MSLAIDTIGVFFGLVLIVISLMKLPDLKGFVEKFRQYDVIAARISWYGYVYPLIELLLGIGFLFHPDIRVPAFWTLVFTALGTIGVLRALNRKVEIQCVCYGTKIATKLNKGTLWTDYITMFLMILILVFD